MKTLIKTGAFSLMLFTFVAFYANAQENLPKREFKLGISTANIELIPGQTSSLEVNIYRSKSYANKEIQLVANSLPEVLTIDFDQEKTTENVAVLTLKADPSMSTGKYTILLQGKTTRVTKGISFSITVNEKSITKN